MTRAPEGQCSWPQGPPMVVSRASYTSGFASTRGPWSHWESKAPPYGSTRGHLRKRSLGGPIGGRKGPPRDFGKSRRIDGPGTIMGTGFIFYLRSLEGPCNPSHWADEARLHSSTRGHLSVSICLCLRSVGGPEWGATGSSQGPLAETNPEHRWPGYYRGGGPHCLLEHNTLQLLYA